VKELINYVVETESKVNQQMQYGEGEDDYNCSDPEDSNFSDGDLHHYEPLHPMHLAGESPVISNGSDISISSNSDDCNDPHMLNDHYSSYYQKGHLLGHVNKNDQNALRKLLPPSLARRNKSFEWCHQCKQRSERVIHCGQGCNKKFCTRCLYRHYGEQETDIIPSTWLCPYCKKICCCAYCRKLKAKSFGPGNALSGARIKRSADTFIEANNMKRVRLTYSNNEIYDEADYEESEDIEDHLQADEEEEEEERMAMHSQSLSMNKPLKEIRTAVTVSERSWEPSNSNSASLFQLPHVNLQLHAGETDHALAPEIDHHEISREMPMTQIKTEQQHPQSTQTKPSEDSFDPFMGWHPKEEWMGNLFTSDLDRHDYGVSLISETSNSMQDYNNNKNVSSTFSTNTQRLAPNSTNPTPQLNVSNVAIPALAQVPLQTYQVPQYANVKQELPNANFASSQKPNNVNHIQGNNQEFYANVLSATLAPMSIKQQQVRPSNTNINSAKNNINSSYISKPKNTKQGSSDEYDYSLANSHNNGSKTKLSSSSNQHPLINHSKSKWNGGNASGGSHVKRDRSRSMPSGGSRNHGGSGRSNSRNSGKKISRNRSTYGRGSDSDSEYLSADNCYDSANTDSESDYESPAQPLPRASVSGPPMGEPNPAYYNPNHNMQNNGSYQTQNVINMNINMGHGNINNSYQHMNGSYHNSHQNSHNLNRSSATQKRARLPAHSVSTLKEWFFRHSDNPYPTEEEKEEFTRKLALTLLQVNNWFTNARRRLLPHSRELM
jgi:hypothetical protein